MADVLSSQNGYVKWCMGLVTSKVLICLFYDNVALKLDNKAIKETNAFFEADYGLD